MANKFQLVIAANDEATAVVKRINTSMSRMSRPISDAGKSFKRFSKEASLNPVVKGVKSLGKAANDTFVNVSNLFPPLKALAGAGTVAGLVSMAQSWGKAGIQATNTARRIGMSVGTFQSFQGVATAAGVSATDMQSALVGLSDTLQGAEFGRNPEALVMMRRLGIGIHRDKNGVVDTARAMNDIADALARIPNPQVQAVIARTFGIENMLPVLTKGSKELNKFMDLAKRMGAVDPEAVQANERLGKSFAMLSLAIEGVENRLAKGGIGRWLARNNEGWAYILSGEIFEKRKKKGSADKAGEAERLRALHESILNGGQGERSGIRSVTTGSDEIARLRALNEQVMNGGQGDAKAIRPINIRPEVAVSGAQPRGIRNNNPGNIEYGDFARRRGAIGNDGRYARFARPEQGIAAMGDNLRAYQDRHGINSIDGVINRWAPAPENDVAAYISDVSRQTGFAPDARLDLHDPKVLAPLISAMIKHENKGRNPYGDQTIQTALVAPAAPVQSGVPSQPAPAAEPSPVQVHVNVTAPPGTTVTAHSGNPGLSTVARVDYNLDTGITP